MSLSLKISWWKSAKIWFEFHPYGLLCFIGYKHLNYIVPMGKACPTPLIGIKFPSLPHRYIPILQTLKEFRNFEVLSPLLYLVCKSVKMVRWKGHKDRLTKGLYKTCFLKNQALKKDIWEEEEFCCHSHLSRCVLPSQQGCRVPESNFGTAVGGKGRKEQMKSQ